MDRGVRHLLDMLRLRYQFTYFVRESSRCRRAEHYGALHEFELYTSHTPTHQAEGQNYQVCCGLFTLRNGHVTDQTQAARYPHNKAIRNDVR